MANMKEPTRSSDTSTPVLLRREWDDPSLDKRSWGKGPWLNEPDKLQFWDEETNYRCLIVRSYPGSLCGYVGIPLGHPAYGLSADGIPSLIAEIIHAEGMEAIRKWYRGGNHGLPPHEGFIEEPDLTPVGEAISRIYVHGGLTYGSSPSIVSEAMWHHVQGQFEKAREIAKQYPIGDAARWLYKWGSVEHDYEAFLRIALSTCICFDPPDDEIWLYGFDCAHAGDLMPAVKALLQQLPIEGLLRKEETDIYCILEYVEGQCKLLAKQLKEIEHASPTP